MKKKYLILALLIWVASNTFSQIGKWPLPPYVINFTNGNPYITNISNGYSDHYYATEAAFDNNGNMLFYVVGPTREIYKPGNSNPIGTLNQMGYGNVMGEQCIVTQVPNNPNKYYVIYSVYDLIAGGDIAFATINCNNGSVTIENSGTSISSCNLLAGMAILEIDNLKYLYFSYYGGALYKFLIESNNISYSSTVLSQTTNLSSDEFETNNLEISLDGRKLAWINYNSFYKSTNDYQIIVVDLDQNGNYSSFQKYEINRSQFGSVRGIEFTTNAENDILYFSSSSSPNTGNIYSLSLNSGSIQAMATNNEFGNTWLQTASDGNIYVVSNDGNHLGKINPYNSTFTSNVLNVTVNSNEYVDYYNGPDIFHLPSNFSFTPFSVEYSILAFESCAGTNDGAIEIIVNGGVLPYQYQWDDPNNQTTATATGLTQGTYSCIVTDAVGRTKTVTVELLTNPSLFNYSGPYNISSNINWQSNHYKIDRPIHIYNGGTLTLKYGAKAEFNANAGFVVHEGGKLIITDNSELSGLVACGNNIWSGITVMNKGYVKGHSFSIRDCQSTIQDGGTMHIDENSNVFLTENAQLVVDDGGYICIAPNAHIDLATTECEVELIDGSLFGVNPLLNLTPTPTCSNDPCDWEITGEGSFHINENYTHLDDVIIQGNQSLTYNNVNWSLKKDLILEANAKLTLNSSDIKMAKTSKIIVKKGAKLTINYTTIDRLESCLADHWMGIEVWGDKYLPQTEANQGKLVLNGATIEHAHEAVQLWRPNDYNTTGGMISAINSTFRNNRRAVSFMSYKNMNFNYEWDYASSFRECTFENTNNYSMDNDFYTFVSMWKVRGVYFTACDFINSAEFPDCQAIYTLDAGYKFQGRCTGIVGPNGECVSGWETNTFTNFEKAIESANTPDPTVIPYSINIWDSYFKNNNYGIYMTSVNNAATILYNEFQIGNGGIDNFEKTNCGYFSTRGIQMNQSFGFNIEENEFHKMQGTTGGDLVGVLVYECPSRLDEIYKNQFSNLTAANQAEGYNRVSEDNDHNGVTYLCNENSNNGIDIYVAEFSKIIGAIGSYVTPAGNKLSNTNPQIRNDYTEEINYFWTNQPNEELLYYSNFVTPIYTNTINDCLSNYGSGCGGIGHDPKVILTPVEKQEVEQEYYESLQDYNAISNLLEQLKDGGSTEITSLTIATAQPDDTWELRSNLLGMSPYLSKEVLMEAADRTDVLPESVLFEILSANPDELRKVDLMEYLENKEQPLPNYMISILNQMATGVSAKTALMGQKFESFANKTKAAQKMIRSIKNEEELDIVALRNWLGNMESIEADKQIVATYLYEDDYTNANALLNMIPDLYDLQGNKLQEFNDYAELLNLQIDLKQQNRNIFMLTETEKAQLVDLAENSAGDARSGAQSILSFVYGNQYCDCITPIAGGGNKSSHTSYVYSEEDMAKALGYRINLKPNPASVYVSVDFTLPISVEQAELQLINAEGKVLQTEKVSGLLGQITFDIRSFKPGTYIFRLLSDKYIISEPVIIE